MLLAADGLWILCIMVSFQAYGLLRTSTSADISSWSMRSWLQFRADCVRFNALHCVRDGMLAQQIETGHVEKDLCRRRPTVSKIASKLTANRVVEVHLLSLRSENAAGDEVS